MVIKVVTSVLGAIAAGQTSGWRHDRCLECRSDESMVFERLKRGRSDQGPLSELVERASHRVKGTKDGRRHCWPDAGIDR